MRVAPGRRGPPSFGQEVEIRGVSKFYGDMRAVDAVSLKVAPGEFLSLLGPSGSGKTSLLMMIAGFETADQGTISVGTRDLTYVAPNERGIGMVFQKYALFPHMTVAQNIAFPLKMRKFPADDIRRKVQETLALVRLEDYGERMPSQLSGGQQQRIAVARAIVFEPPVLLMDEPLGALDKKLREQLQIEIKQLQQRLGITVIYVTHDQEEALTMSDRVAVMCHGRLEQIGTPVELYERPGSALVADFIGKMNFIDGEWVGLGGAAGIVRVKNCGSLAAHGNPRGSDAVLAARQPVRMAIRPEQWRISKQGQGGEYVLDGVIQNAIFVGSYRVFLVRLADEGVVQVQLPAGQASQHLAEGESVELSCEPEAIHLFPARIAG
ncbi:ABC transporter ATP-binding protein [Bradyrhizobium oligotrophicum]